MEVTLNISDEYLQERGYIHIDRVDRAQLAEMGYFNIGQVKNMPLSIWRASKMLSIKEDTLKAFVAEGFIPVTEDNRIMLHDLLRFDKAYARFKHAQRKWKSRPYKGKI